MAEKKNQNPTALQNAKKTSQNQHNDNKKQKGKTPSKVEKPSNAKKMFFSIAPYVMLVLALVYTLCLIIVKFIDEDGAGIVGLWINNILCGLLGGAAFLLPIEMIYIYLRQILFNIRWKDNDRRHDSVTYPDYAKEKKKMIQKHFNYLLKLKNEKTALLEMRTISAYYLKGVKNSAKIKERIFKTKTKEELLEIINKI